jgi:hypothetical protein
MSLGKSKKAAMEMSVGTIVTIVLLMTVLVLGIVLVRNIFMGSIDVVDMTEKQLKDEVNKLFSEDKKLVIYPDTTEPIEAKQEETTGVGIGIKNLLEGASGTETFNYQVTVSDPDLSTKCGGIRIADVESWMVTGRTENNIPIPVGDVSAQKVIFKIPTGAPLCTIRFRVNVNEGTNYYSTAIFDIETKAK